MVQNRNVGDVAGNVVVECNRRGTSQVHGHSCGLCFNFPSDSSSGWTGTYAVPHQTALLVFEFVALYFLLWRLACINIQYSNDSFILPFKILVGMARVHDASFTHFLASVLGTGDCSLWCRHCGRTFNMVVASQETMEGTDD
jgi:hypothetical protein